MRNYLELLQDVLDSGVSKGDRTGTGTLSVFGRQLRFDLSQGFPICTTKQVNFESALKETLWFLSGSTNVNDLDTRIWDNWADSDGNLGPVYGKQWREWGNCSRDQIADLIAGIKANPHGRRHVVTAWNPDEVDDCRLPPCHVLFQCYVSDYKLSLHFYMRTNDLFLGLPYNLINYASLTHMIAQQCDLEVGDLIYSVGDAHIYKNHIDQVKLQLSRGQFCLALPTLSVIPAPSIFDYTVDHFKLVNYQHSDPIKAPIAI